MGGRFGFDLRVSRHSHVSRHRHGVRRRRAAALDLRVLGVAPRVPLAEMRRFVPVLWLGFWVNAVSGVLLLIGYPTKALTNPVFYLKLILIATAMVLFVRISRRVYGHDASAPSIRSCRERCAAWRSSRWCAGRGRSPPAASSLTPTRV